MSPAKRPKRIKKAEARTRVEKEIRKALETEAKELRIIGSGLTSLPDSIGLLTQLENINLSGNELTTLPDSIGRLTHLKSLDLSRNRLTTLPDSIGRLTQLESLDLSSNGLFHCSILGNGSATAALDCISFVVTL